MLNRFDTASLGKRILFHRKRLGLTQATLANKLHVSYQAISAWENASTLPDIDNLCRLAEVFDISLDDLMKHEADSKILMLGIDGGGTKTEFVVFDQNGFVLKRICLSGSNASHIGVDGTLELLRDGIDKCVDEFPEIQAIHVGIAGPGSSLEVVHKKLKERFFNKAIFVYSDAVNALKSAEGDFALICGTGSILITDDNDGKYRYIGGWGTKFGDPCSGYNFGNAALRNGFSFEEGLISDDTIYRMIVEQTGHTDLHAYASMVDAPSIAQLAPIVFKAYENGCETAKDILASEAQDLANLLNAAFPDGGKLIVCGSVIKNNKDTITAFLNEFTDGKFSYVVPTLPPIYGSCVACCEEFELPRGNDFAKNFEESYNKIQL